MLLYSIFMDEKSTTYPNEGGGFSLQVLYRALSTGEDSVKSPQHTQKPHPTLMSPEHQQLPTIPPTTIPPHPHHPQKTTHPPTKTPTTHIVTPYSHQAMHPPTHPNLPTTTPTTHPAPPPTNPNRP
jgi:hypothetical protein